MTNNARQLCKSKIVVNVLHIILYGKKESEINVIPKGDKPFKTLHIYHLSIIDERVTCKKYI